MLEYDVFYKSYGVRIFQHLLTPKLSPIERFSFPKDSLYHYVSHDSVDVGPSSDNYYLRDVHKVIPIEHVTTLLEHMGPPKANSVAITTALRKYQSQNRRYRNSNEPDLYIKDRNTLIVYNYGFLHQSYRYIRSIYSSYYSWWNIQCTMCKTMDIIASRSDRQQFFFVDLPKIIPSVGTLNIFKSGLSQLMLKSFDTPEALTLLEIWKWLDPEVREQSSFSRIKKENLKKINLVYQDSGQWFVFNLGLLDSWRYTGVEEDQKVKIPATQLQKSFLKALVTLMRARTEVLQDQAQAETDVTEQDDTLEKAQVEYQVAENNAEIDQTKLAMSPTDEEAWLKEMKARTGSLLQEEAPTLPDGTPIDQQSPRSVEQGSKTNTGSLDALETEISSKQVLAQKALIDLDEDLKQLEVIEQMVQAKAESEQKRSEELRKDTDAPVDANTFAQVETPESVLFGICNELAEDGLMTASEYKRMIQSASNYKTMKAPGTNESLESYIAYKPEEMVLTEPEQIRDIPTVLDKTMLKTSLLDFDNRYIDKVLHKDIAKMVVGVQKAGVILGNYEVEKVETVQGDYEMHTLRMRPIEGLPSTLRFRLPVVDHEGNFTSNGVKYKLRKQRVDLPIRKTAPDTVALTSYYGKTFVTRSNKKINDYANWLRNKIMVKGLDVNDHDVTNIHPGDGFDHLFGGPMLYSGISQGFRSFTASGYLFVFDHRQREKLFGSADYKKLENKTFIVVAKSLKDDTYLLMDKNNTLYKAQNGTVQPLGTLESMLNIDTVGAPVDFAEVKIFGKLISVGLVLAYKLGLDKTLELLKVQPRRVPPNTRLNLEADEWTMVFSDETLVFSRQDRLATMVLAGMAGYKALRNYSVYAFDKKDVYLNVLESTGVSNRYLREIDLLDALFVDPITDELLQEMNEPRTFRGLLVRASQLLLTDKHPDALDMRYMRIRGYERLAGAAYTEMVQAIRDQRAKSGRGSSQIELHPYAVWKRVMEDPAKSQVSDINPIQNLKESEAVTFGGVGGRSSRSMVKRTRKYHPNDMGIISEATVDSGDVAINTFLSANPKFNSLRGTSKGYDFKKDGATSLVSTSALLAVASDKDTAKRVNFVSIQHGHGIACKGYKVTPVRTGYEQVIAHRTGDMFATSARMSGKVLSVTKTGLVVQYDDGEKRGIEIGRRFGQAAGLTIPHDIIANVSIGDTFQKNDILAYNTGFFEKDVMNPKNVVWKAGLIVRTALMESNLTLEDGSAISKKTAELMQTKTTKIKTLVVGFDQSVRQLVKAGQTVEPESILCIIEDAVTSNSNLFDEDSLNTLRMLSSQAPSAKVKGVIDRIEVFYHGELEDMSDSLREIAEISDKEMVKRNRSYGKTAFTGSVSDDFRVDGDPLNLDTMAIRIYITTDVSAGVGD